MRALALLSILALAACGGEPEREPEDKSIPSVVKAARPGPAVESNFGTPVKDRVATIGLLNKRNNLTQDLILKSGESRRVGNVVVRVATCERTLPWESPPETGAFVQVFVEERARADEQLAWRKVFSGWLFKTSPSLNVVEHPVYDVWVKDCAMKFPGEEEDPAAAASSSKAANPQGRATGAPRSAPAPRPVTTPTAAPPSPPAPPVATPSPA